MLHVELDVPYEDVAGQYGTVAGQYGAALGGDDFLDAYLLVGLFLPVGGVDGGGVCQRQDDGDGHAHEDDRHQAVSEQYALLVLLLCQFSSEL